MGELCLYMCICVCDLCLCIHVNEMCLCERCVSLSLCCVFVCIRICDMHVSPCICCVSVYICARDTCVYVSVYLVCVSMQMMSVSVCVMCVSVGLLCCPFVCGMSVFVTLCLGVSPWCLRGSLWCVCLWSWGFTLSVACVGLCDALTFLRGRVHLCRGPACLCVLSAAHHPCVFVCDVYVSPSAERCPPLYVLCLSVRVSATWVSHVWAACACLTSASWRGAHVSVLVACHSSVRARHGGPWVPPTRGSAGPCLSLPLPSLLAANATGEPVAMTTLHPPSLLPPPTLPLTGSLLPQSRLSSGAGPLFSPPFSPLPPHPSNPGSPAPLLCLSLHPFICLSLQRGGGGSLSL